MAASSAENTIQVMYNVYNEALSKRAQATKADFSSGGFPVASLLKIPSAYVILTGSGGVRTTAQAGKNTSTDISGNTTFVKRRNTRRTAPARHFAVANSLFCPKNDCTQPTKKLTPQSVSSFFAA